MITLRPSDPSFTENILGLKQAYQSGIRPTLHVEVHINPEYQFDQYKHWLGKVLYPHSFDSGPKGDYLQVYAHGRAFSLSHAMIKEIRIYLK